MSERSRLLAEAGKQISNPFLLCALVSQRTRQLMMEGKADRNTAQMVDSALNEVIAGAIEFELGKRRHGFWFRQKLTTKKGMTRSNRPECRKHPQRLVRWRLHEQAHQSPRTNAEGRLAGGDC
jgi:DNA-directed RNA polymerase subunit K/omega